MIGSFLIAIALGAGTAAEAPAFVAEVRELPAEVRALVLQHSWREGCPVPLGDLVYVTLTHWGYDARAHQGELIVHRQAAAAVREIFAELFAARFPVEKMRLIDHYQGDDDRSMADNNTSAFNCRPVAGRRVYSNHAYGLAIDINPRVNPYVTEAGVAPPGGAEYVDRTRRAPGLIVAGDACHAAFTRRGWSWGGAWRRSKDYQHFELRLELNRRRGAVD